MHSFSYDVCLFLKNLFVKKSLFVCYYVFKIRYYVFKLC